MVTILMISAKMATLDLLRIKVFLNNGHDVIIFVYDVPTKFYHVIQFMLSMWSYDQSSVTLGLL